MALPTIGNSNGRTAADFPNAQFESLLDMLQQQALDIFRHDWTKIHQIQIAFERNGISIESVGDPFEDSMGQLSTYGNIARGTGESQCLQGRRVGSEIILLRFSFPVIA
jgi:AraC family transcriptional regulator of adaptative response/methylated-DNA-[protein]-cysteine methyltransferase